MHLWLGLEEEDVLLEFQYLLVVVESLRSEVLTHHNVAVDGLVLGLLMAIEQGMHLFLAILDGKFMGLFLRALPLQRILVRHTLGFHLAVVLR